MWRIKQISEDVGHLSLQSRYITSSSICIILHILLNLRSIQAFAGEFDEKAGTKAKKRDGRGKEGRKGTLSSKRHDSEKCAPRERHFRLVQRSSDECKDISTSIKSHRCVPNEMLSRKFHLNCLWAIHPSKYNLRSSSGSHFIGICMGEKNAIFKAKLTNNVTIILFQ